MAADRRVSTIHRLFDSFRCDGAISRYADSTANAFGNRRCSGSGRCAVGFRGAILSGAALLKNTVGIWGMLAILAICLLPVLRLAVQYLVFKATAFLAGTIGMPQLVELVDALGTAFGMVLGMTGACALLLLISVITAISVVVV